MKKLFILILFFALAILAAQSNTVFAETKKVLVLHIIEENWDDLEFIMPKSRGIGLQPTTKKEALKEFEGYREKAIKKDATIKEMMKGDILNTMKLAVPNAGISQQESQLVSGEYKLYVKHEIAYLGKAYYLKDDDSFIKEAFRNGFNFQTTDFNYYYEKVPQKISLLLAPNYFDKTSGKFRPYLWNKFEEIRLVEDIFINSTDSIGNLKIKYEGEEYNLKVGSILELPAKEKILSRNDMMKFREKYFAYYAKEYPWKKPEEYSTSFLKDISIPNETFHFGTKVTIINLGFDEISGD